MRRAPLRVSTLLGAGPCLAAVALVGARPTEVVSVGRWRERLEVDPTQALALAAESALWLLLAWLAAGVVLCALAELPGRVGAAGAAAARVVTPALLRRVVEVLLGAGLTVGLAAPGAGACPPAAPGSAASAGVAHDERSWQSVAAQRLPPPIPPAGRLPPPGEPEGRPRRPALPAPAPQLAPPAGPAVTTGPAGVAPAPRAPVTRAARDAAADVVVRPGDCLWSLARHALGPGATDAAIAATWPRWWHANAAVIGAEPDLLRPGQHLRPPAPDA